jgi:hypothetical protein
MYGLEPPTPEPPSPLFMNANSPRGKACRPKKIDLIPVSEAEVELDDGTPRSQPFLLKQKQAVAPAHVAEKPKAKRRPSIDKNGREYRVDVVQNGNRTSTKVVSFKVGVWISFSKSLAKLVCGLVVADDGSPPPTTTLLYAVGIFGRRCESFFTRCR